MKVINKKEGKVYKNATPVARLKFDKKSIYTSCIWDDATHISISRKGSNLKTRYLKENFVPYTIKNIFKYIFKW